ncbi:MAG: DUF4402 domain-containing protein [Gammaproteobacteria bacterium]|nr:DUF4402 domain-containing protein [Gammaproteobacteria bacterium]
MIARRITLGAKRAILAIFYLLIMSGLPHIPPEAAAAPVCPPACPPNPANCDANLVITPTQALQFGRLAAPAAGTVTVDVFGARTASGGVVLIAGGTVSPATFNMSTTPYKCAGRAIVVVTVASPATLTETGSGATMTVDTFVTSPIAGDAFDPNIPLAVGGTLNVGSLQSPGAYNGAIQVTVTFQ